MTHTELRQAAQRKLNQIKFLPQTALWELREILRTDSEITLAQQLILEDFLNRDPERLPNVIYFQDQIWETGQNKRRHRVRKSKKSQSAK